MKLRLLFAAAGLLALVHAAAAAPPQIAFSAPRFNITVPPSASIAYLYAIGARQGGGVLSDTDGDGRIAIDAGVGSLPNDFGLVVVNTRTGEYASASHAQLAGHPERSILRGPNGLPTELVILKKEALALWVRPLVGVWSPPSFVLEDADGVKTNNIAIGSVTKFRPLGSSPSRPGSLGPGDLLFYIGTTGSQPFGGPVDVRLLDPPHPGVLTFFDTGAPVAVTEGTDVVLPVYRLSGSEGTVTIRCRLGESGDTAVSGVDYEPFDSVVAFGPGEIVKLVRVRTIDDAAWARPRSATARLSGGSTNNPVTRAVTIADDDPPPVAGLEAPAAVTETDETLEVSATITVANARREAVTVRFEPGAKTVVFQPNESRKTVTFTIPGDDEARPDYTVRLSAELVETGQKAAHEMKVVDDELPTVSIADVTVQEGSRFNLEPVIRPFVPAGMTFRWTTADGTATAGLDYVASSGTYDQPGSPWELRTMPDGTPEGNEVFYIDLTGAEKVTLTPARITVTILDDDAIPVPVFSNLSAVEGNGYLWRSVPVTLTLPVPLSSPVTYQVKAANGTATAHDFVAYNGAVTFQAGQTITQVPLQILGDDHPEDDETFTLSITGTNATATYTIIDDDTGVTPSMSIADASFGEGTGGNRIVMVRVTLSAAVTHLVLADVATLSASAAAGADFTPVEGRISFAAGATFRDIEIAIVGDGIAETDERFLVVLSSPAGATLARSTAVVTIVDDDEGPGRRRSVRH